MFVNEKRLFGVKWKRQVFGRMGRREEAKDLLCGGWRL